ncbi:MAG: hypothetical protein WCO29_12470 [Nostocales cyanobacterium ELA583]|jgi:hypothetical protein
MGRQLLWEYTSTFSFLKRAQAINEGYHLSIKEALVTEYPHGVVYILENVLQHLENFDLNFLPERHQHNWLVYGWPNQTKLKEAIRMAKILSFEWEKLNPAEQSQAMENIRQKIQTEDMYLGGNWVINNLNGEIDYKGVDLDEIHKQDIIGIFKSILDSKSRKERYLRFKNYLQFKIYKYYYGYDDYQADLAQSNEGYRNPSLEFAQSPPKIAAQEVSSFTEWVQNNPVIQKFTESQQRKAYQKYLFEKGVSDSVVMSFAEWVESNPVIQKFTESQQRKAYQKYLSEKDNSINILYFEEYIKQNSGLEFFTEEEQQEQYQNYLKENQ